MPKLLSVLAAVCLIAACSPQETEQDKTAENISPAAPQVPLDEEIYSFDLNTLTPGCSGDSQIICAINMSVKCTINPEFSECAEHKDEMPDFVFMQDESLQRPTSQSYKSPKYYLWKTIWWKSIPKAPVTATGLASVTETSFTS